MVGLKQNSLSLVGYLDKKGSVQSQRLNKNRLLTKKREKEKKLQLVIVSVCRQRNKRPSLVDEAIEPAERGFSAGFS